ncbi:MAG: Trp biosynthesis-associated membrane protein [Austwickia sp.]|jgi:hypothetical protein|nr:MAG: Trp biosynthesis-associated membrane protein [Austwickia sp.]
MSGAGPAPRASGDPVRSGGAAPVRAGVLTRRATAVLVALAGAGLGLIVAARPLATGQAGAGGVTTGARLSATGSGLAPAYPALLLVAAAAAATLAFAGPRLRVVVAVLLGAAGLGAEVAWRAGLGDAAAGLSRSTVPPGLPVHDVTVSSLAWIGDLAALVVLLGAGLALAFGSRWGRGSRRYDAPVDPAGSAGAGIASAASGVPGPPGDAAGVADGPGAAEPRQPGTSGRPRNATSGAGRTEASHVSEAASRRADDDWDALSRGEDPTL